MTKNEKNTYKKVLTKRKKGVNIIEDQARKRSIKIRNKKTFKNFKKSVDKIRQAW